MKPSQYHEVVIVGAGHGGSQVAITLRQRKFLGTIALVGDELHLPYERPPLSKNYLAGEYSFDRLLLRPSTFWESQNISLQLGQAVVAVDPHEQVVTLGDGSLIGYGSLVWAAGGSPRALPCPGATSQCIHTLRRREDVDTLRQQLRPGRRVAIVGAGYIGLEVAATLTKIGVQLTVLESLGRVLARVTAEPLSRFFEAEHRAHSVRILLGATIRNVEAEGGRATGLVMEDGTRIAADVILAGIGIEPVWAPLRSAGASGDDGVSVDEYGRTSLPNVYALGDCALQKNRHAQGAAVRIESVANACEMAVTVAKAILGQPEPYRAVPWFWSNQFDLRLQTVGLSAMHDDIIVRGDLASRSFSIVYLRRGHVIALDCVNAPKDFAQGRLLIGRGGAADTHALADPRIPLKEVAISPRR